MSTGCHIRGLERYCPDERVLCLSWGSFSSNLNGVCHVRHTVAPLTRGAGSNKFVHLRQTLSERNPPCHSLWQTYSVPVGLEEQSSSGAPDIQDDETDSEDQLARPPSSQELKAMLADSERAKLLKKLSEANQQNRFLKRQLQGKEDALIHFKTELAAVEQEIKALVALADEIAKAGIPEGSRKIKGKFIQSHLLSRLEAVQKKLQDQIKEVDVAESKEVPVFWIGMAEPSKFDFSSSPHLESSASALTRVCKSWVALMVGVTESTYPPSTLAHIPNSQPPYCFDPAGMKLNSWWMESGKYHRNSLPWVTG